jgi:hypothetical protein
MKDGEIVKINNLDYRYSKFYDRLELIGNESKEHIACPKCNSTTFTISYGTYECIANCSCGHSMTVYDG